VEKLNIYDTKQISCSQCGVWIGEVDYDAQVILPKCGKCANPLPEGDDILYGINKVSNKKEILVTV
jgi:hypothetical protein